MRLDPRMKDALLLGAAFSFMIAIFAPLDAYMANADEFWFGLKDLLPIVLGAFFACFCALGLLFYVNRKNRFFLGLYSFMLSAYMYFYLQGNYAPRNYGVLDGKTIDWGAYESYGIISIVLLLSSLVFWGFAVFKFRARIYKIGRYVCFFIILIQFITLSVLITQNLMFESDKHHTVLTDEGWMDLSKERNIIVFIVDTFDSIDMDRMLENPYGERTKSIFKDFTYYRDTVGAYPTTKGAVPFILTGQWYENEEKYTDYIYKAYRNAKRYQVLRSNGYSIGLYTMGGFVFSDNDDFINIYSGTYELKECYGFFKKLYRLVAFNYMPHYFKKRFYISADEFDNHKTVKAKETVNRKEKNSHGYSLETQDFYENFIKSSMILSEQKALRVYHIMGVHKPYTFGEDLISHQEKKYTVLDEAAGCFTLLEAFIKRLQDNEIYNNSTIIVMADHGHIGMSHRPLFMIKNAGESHEFRISSEKMSYEYFDDIVTALAKQTFIDDEFVAMCHKKYSEPRRYLFYAWNNSWARKYLPEMSEFYFSGAANDWNNMIFSGRVFDGADTPADRSYKLGEKLFFDKRATSNRYYILGFRKNEKNGTWTDGNVSIMQFDVKDKFNSLLLEMEYLSEKKQRVEVYVNNQLISNFFASGKEKKTLIIPHKCVNDGKVILRFSFPDVVLPKEEARVRALYLSEMVFLDADSIEGENNSVISYKLGKELFFDKQHATANRYFVDGFSHNEAQGTWTEGHESVMQFELASEYADLMLEMKYKSYGKQKVEVYANDHLISDFVANGDEKQSLRIPHEYIVEGNLVLRFTLPDAVSPKSQGKSNDGRDLALYMRSLKLSSVSAESR